ncbi:hypothetical protein GGQ06_003048 [Salinibacter ruber]|nr:hypothetical protein [Salinibacter ruber]
MFFQSFHIVNPHPEIRKRLYRIQCFLNFG